MSHRERRRAAGFTLIELMVTCAVIAILAVVAAPAMTSVINGSRLSGQASDLASMLQLARSEAVRRNGSVSVCGSANGTTCGGGWANWLVVDSSNRVLQVGAAKPPVEVSSASGTITYRSTGFAEAASITVCIPTGQPAENRRIVSVTVGGQVSTAKANGGGTCT